jgi:hypothetical protein
MIKKRTEKRMRRRRGMRREIMVGIAKGGKRRERRDEIYKKDEK